MASCLGVYVDHNPLRRPYLKSLRLRASARLGLGPTGSLEEFASLLYPYDDPGEARVMARYRDSSALWALRLCEWMGLRHELLSDKVLVPGRRPLAMLETIGRAYDVWHPLPPEGGTWGKWPAPGTIAVFSGDPGHVSVVLDEDLLGLLVSIDAGQPGCVAIDDDRSSDGSIQVVRRRLIRRSPGILQAFHPMTSCPGRQLSAVFDLVGASMRLPCP